MYKVTNAFHHTNRKVEEKNSMIITIDTLYVFDEN